MLIASATFFVGCRKDGEIINHQPAQSCNSFQAYDSLTSATKLIGTWKLISVYNPWTNTTSLPDRTVLVTFYSDGTFYETENSVVSANGNWHLQDAAGSGLGIITSVPCFRVSGTLSFCSQQALFFTGFIDGPVHLFEKIL